MTRWCDYCDREHGELYICEHYPVEVRDQIGAAQEEWRRNLNNPEWIDAQIASAPEDMKNDMLFALAVQRAFAGLETHPSGNN